MPPAFITRSNETFAAIAGWTFEHRWWVVLNHYLRLETLPVAMKRFVAMDEKKESMKNLLCATLISYHCPVADTC